MGRWRHEPGALFTTHATLVVQDNDIRTFVALAILLSGGSLDEETSTPPGKPYHMEKLMNVRKEYIRGTYFTAFA